MTNDLALTWIRYIRWLITPGDHPICPEVEIVEAAMKTKKKQG